MNKFQHVRTPTTYFPSDFPLQKQLFREVQEGRRKTHRLLVGPVRSISVYKRQKRQRNRGWKSFLFYLFLLVTPVSFASKFPFLATRVACILSIFRANLPMFVGALFGESSRRGTTSRCVILVRQRYLSRNLN